VWRRLPGLRPSLGELTPLGALKSDTFLSVPYLHNRYRHEKEEESRSAAKKSGDKSPHSKCATSPPSSTGAGRARKRRRRRGPASTTPCETGRRRTSFQPVLLGDAAQHVPVGIFDPPATESPPRGGGCPGRRRSCPTRRQTVAKVCRRRRFSRFVRLTRRQGVVQGLLVHVARSHGGPGQGCSEPATSLHPRTKRAQTILSRLELAETHLLNGQQFVDPRIVVLFYRQTAVRPWRKSSQWPWAASPASFSRRASTV